METFRYILIDNMSNIEFIIEEHEIIVKSEFDKVTTSQADIYYKFRYTFTETDSDLEKQRGVIKYLINILKPCMSSEYYTFGIEWFKSGMIDCKPHVHIHFVSRTKKDTIVKKLKRAPGCYMDGNRCYSLGVEVNVDKEKFFRYPLKQQRGDTRKCCGGGGFEKPIMESMVECAYAVWLTAAEVMNKKIEKKENNDQLSDRLFVYLDNLGQLDNDLSIKIGIQKFYIEQEQKPFNRTTALGYMYNYKIARKKMTHEELAATW